MVIDGRSIGPSRVHRRTYVGGVVAGAVFALAAPGAGLAFAHETNPTPSGNAVSRDGFDNPAPGVRMTQAAGDRVFNQNTTVNRAIDNSVVGQRYHEMYGTPNYDDPGHGTNGTMRGVLNSGGPLQEWYDGAQAAGLELPSEKDLPGTWISVVSGSPVTDRGRHGGVERAVSERCVSVSAATVLSAQGSC